MKRIARSSFPSLFCLRMCFLLYVLVINSTLNSAEINKRDGSNMTYTKTKSDSIKNTKVSTISSQQCGNNKVKFEIYLRNWNDFDSIVSINSEPFTSLFDDTRISFEEVFSAQDFTDWLYVIDNGNRTGWERYATTDLCFQACFNISGVNFFRRETHIATLRGASFSLSSHGFPVLTSDDKMTKGWSPRASDITIPISKLCELSSIVPLFSRVLRPKTLRDWLCPPYFWFARLPQKPIDGEPNTKRSSQTGLRYLLVQEHLARLKRNRGNYTRNKIWFLYMKKKRRYNVS